MSSLRCALPALVLLLAVPQIAAADEPAAGSEVAVTGMLTDEGVECPALRSDDGRLYTLSSRDIGSFHSGDRVRVEGTVAAVSVCMQGTTIAVATIEPAN